MDNTVHAQLGAKMEQDYEKKDIKESPSTKAASKSDMPEGWEYFVRRSKHCVRGPDGIIHKFYTKSEAVDHANG